MDKPGLREDDGNTQPLIDFIKGLLDNVGTHINPRSLIEVSELPAAVVVTVLPGHSQGTQD